VPEKDTEATEEKKEAMAQLTISERQDGNVTILDLNGKITIGEGSVKLRETVRRLLEEGKKQILINLGSVDYVDSSGIGELVSCYTTTKNQGGTLKLLSLTKKIKDLLQITKLLTVFETFDDEREALGSY
jgi:anti-sigma B factor antagonist